MPSNAFHLRVSSTIGVSSPPSSPLPPCACQLPPANASPRLPSVGTMGASIPLQCQLVAFTSMTSAHLVSPPQPPLMPICAFHMQGICIIGSNTPSTRIHAFYTTTCAYKGKSLRDTTSSLVDFALWLQPVYPWQGLLPSNFLVQCMHSKPPHHIDYISQPFLKSDRALLCSFAQHVPHAPLNFYVILYGKRA